ncbi:MAG TPA: hypothetical protein VKR53_19935 [Puia sp.]|nr:hypothetical protein [Puia sp.]
MKIKYYHLLIYFSLLVLCPGCSVVAGIFKAGVWVGIIAVLLILGLVVFAISRNNK